ncbi:hypothetical protein THII_3045 [Thioploca ingrica]|uniref:Calx-beta domain-containing protein n=1 Tax=Thioploca ingrica TaxID=40754 RepID=A0A090AMW0_9GAMM|nr:hypothetical protein THII_3045 [Thioploca ingrica]
MNLNFKVKPKQVNPYYPPISPNLQRLGKKGLYGSLSLMFALTMGLGTPAQADGNPYGRIEWEKHTYKVGEDEGKVYLVAKRTEGTDGAISVKYGTRGKSAKPRGAYGDYQATEGILTWAAGNKDNKSVEIQIYDDAQHEGNEDFEVVLFDDPANSTTVELGEAATVIIDDNDQPAQPVVPPTLEKLIAFLPSKVNPKPPVCLSCPIVFKFTYKFGMTMVYKSRSAADDRASDGEMDNFDEASQVLDRNFDGGMLNFDEASQAFLMGLQNGLAQLNLPDVEVSVTEAGAVLSVPIYNAQGELEGEYHAVAGQPVATSETQEGISSTASGAIYLVYQDESGNYWRSNLYATLAPEILTALQLNFPDAQITQEEEVVTLTLGEYESYRFVANHFVDSANGLDTDPFNAQLIDADNNGVADYAVLSAAGKEQFVYSVN